VELASLFKIVLLKEAVKKHNLPALIIGIRWDEHPERISEKYFSPREDHMRVHPLLHFTEKDIWDYIKLHKVPYVSLYDKGYRSLGEKEFTKPATNDGGERSGRQKEREIIMKKLRRLGYF
jgi:phosphoadenosine phosphosulfate reductase